MNLGMKLMNAASAMPMPMALVNVDKNADVSAVKLGSEDQTNMSKKVNKSNSMKKRYRGKRKPKRKENRRRARPGRSRHGFLAIGAPFNNNEFLINQMQRDAMGGKQKMCTQDMDYIYSHLDKEQTICHHHEGNNHIATCTTTTSTTTSTSLETMAISARRGTTCCGRDSTPCSTSSRNTETSDYDSLHSPTESSSVCSNHWEAAHAGDDILDDELFDVDFAMRNFEADYSAHQREMKEQLIKLPRQQLEIRCSLLMDQLKDLEERSQMLNGMSRVKELELELDMLRKENRLLRGVTAE